MLKIDSNEKIIGMKILIILFFKRNKYIIFLNEILLIYLIIKKKRIISVKKFCKNICEF